MKYFLILLFTSVAANANARHPLEYDTCNTLQQYQGEWMNVSGTDTLRIYLRPVRTFEPVYNNIDDILWGWIEYKQGSNIIMSNYANRNLPVSNSWDFMFNSTNLRLRKYICNSEKLEGTFRDINHHNGMIDWSADIIVSPTEVKMNIWQQRASHYNLNLNDTAMTLPSRFTLIKH
ncbi:MAG: hypothetical protein IPL97_04180 [Niastella sp.]|nr:hypothetical protein [Niastella sp.]